MTRSDLVAQLAERFSQLTHRDTEFAVKTILDAMSDALARGHRIEIRGFGSFSINRRRRAVGRNPRSGEQVVIPEKLVPSLQAGQGAARVRRRADAGGRRAGRRAPADGNLKAGREPAFFRPDNPRIARCGSSSGSFEPSFFSRSSHSR
jgi:integration host factor subunit beta